MYIDPTQEEAQLLIPLNWDTVQDHFTLIEQERLYGAAMHLVFNSSVTRRIPWYATNFFKGLLAIVAIVITVFSYGSAGPAIKAVFASYTVAYGVIGGALLLAFEYVAIAALFNFGLSIIAEAVGPEVALIAGIIGTVASFTNLSNLINGVDLLQLSTGLVKASIAETNRLLLDIVNDQEQFDLLNEERFTELDDLQKELDNDISPNLLDSIGLVPDTVFGEEPSQFYERTLGAPALISAPQDYIENYVAINTRLPTFNDTYRGIDLNAIS